MKTSEGTRKKNKATRQVAGNTRNSRNQLLPALMAVGGACGMVAVPAIALELGEMDIKSSLGEPLRASIAYALNPHEELYDFCVYLRPGVAASGLPVISRATASIANGRILLTGSQAIREPLLTMHVSINCPYTANLSREYTVMLNPPAPEVPEGPTVVEHAAAIEPQAAAATKPQPSAATKLQSSAATKPQSRAQSRADLDLSPISERSRYRVQRGDTLSEIAARISDRSIALWPAVDRIFAANPDAFLDGNMDRLKAGSWLEIPDLSIAATEPMISESVSTVADAPVGKSEDLTAYTGPDATADTNEPITAVSDAEVTATTEVTPEPTVTESDAVANSEFAEIEPGDVVVSSDGPFVTPIGAESDGTTTIDIPDTEIVEPAVQPVPVVNIGQNNDTTGKTSGSWSWLVWLGGTGLALILGLLLFGQRFRQRFGSIAVSGASEPLPSRRRTDASAEATEAADDANLRVPDASPQSISMTLDADFDDGAGLQDAAEMDVAQDFGFSASSTYDEELDTAIREDTEAEDTSEDTDILPTLERECNFSVLESELVPDEDEDADYDVSMVVDATKENVIESDATNVDLRAVQIDSDSKPESVSDDRTLNEDVDYKILEQDYQEESTATQVLNAEIEKAAAELTDRMNTDAGSEVTAKLPENIQAVNDDMNDTGETEQMPARLVAVDDDATARMPTDHDDVTVDMPTDHDATVQMPADHDDVTVDMPTDHDATVQMPTDNDADTVDVKLKPRKIGTKKNKSRKVGTKKKKKAS